MEKYNFDRIRKEYEVEVDEEREKNLSEPTIHAIFISRQWIGFLIGLCEGLQKQITELEEAMQKMKGNS